MITFKHVPLSGDPSDRVQHFVPVSPNIMCCRYWWLEKWTSHEMAFPYWRLYWNKNNGAYVKTHQKIFLSPEKIILIPPDTSFSTGIDYLPVTEPSNPNDLVGNRIIDLEDEKQKTEKGRIAHLFIHFTLGFKLDKVRKQVYAFKINNGQRALIDSIIKKLLNESSNFDAVDTLIINRLILSAVSLIPSKYFETPKVDPRINYLLEFIDENAGGKLTNKILAEKIYMTTNSFTRLFKEQMKVSPQEYVRKVRIDKACNLIENRTVTIDNIAYECGFTDRFHFSKVFKKQKGIPPVEYRKRYVLDYK